MSGPADPQGQAATLIARFDAARDGFLAAFTQASDEALPYTPAGEEYALGVLPLHLQDSMNHYLEVYDRMAEANFGPVDLGADLEMVANAAELHQRLLTTKPTGADRPALLDDLNATHRRVTERFSALDDASVTRQVAVVYSPGTDPYPTSVATIFDWLTDHYDEHIAQTTQLIERWQAEQAEQAR
ncbi:MAG TPA: DinB family protein [Ktedonobacterales bacterium]|nr:DinB family protein [Ktedonobacterales bacterium]